VWVVQVVADENDVVWIMLHSGSRNIGNTTAQYHDKVAQAQMKKRGIAATGGLNYLEIESAEGTAYLQVCFLGGLELVVSTQACAMQRGFVDLLQQR
jgi:RNA-splicing ligase RtcB